MFREALGYPTRPPEGGRSVIVGGLALTVVGLCLGIAALDSPYAYLAVAGLLPWLVVRGYYVRIIRTTIGQRRPIPPRFDGVRRLFSDGVTAVGIAVIYLLPAVAVLGPLVAIQALDVDISSLPIAGSVPETAVTVIVPVVGLFAIVALMGLLGALYVLPVAVARFAHSGRWRDALEFRTVVRGAMTEDYAIAWSVSIVLRALLLPISYVLQFLLVGFFLQFIVGVGVRYCYGQGVGAALGLSPVESVRPASDTDEGETEPKEMRHPTPAVVRVDTAAWGVSPGESAEPMTKSTRFEGSDDANTGVTEIATGEGTVRDPEPGDEEIKAEFDGKLRSAVRRVSDESVSDATDGESSGDR